MANISQKISSYIYGISQQPDHLKMAGQVRRLLNGLPDVTEGLTKRPGSEIISELNTNTDGKWFTIFRDAREKYVCQITNGGIRIWSLIDGLPRVVRYNSTPDLEKPDDGGSGLPPNFDGDTGGTPTPPTGGGTGIPATCDMVAYTKASNAYIDSKVAYDKKKQQHEQAQQNYNTKKADPKTEVYVAANWSNPWGIIIVILDGYGIGSDGSIRAYGNAVGKRMAELRPSDNNKYDIQSRGYYNESGTYTQAEIDAAQAAVSERYVELITLDIAVQNAKAVFDAEEASCKFTTALSVPTLARSTAIPYLQGTVTSDIETLTLNDYTFLVNKKVVISMGKDTSTQRPYEAFIEVKNIEYNSEYAITLTKPGTTVNKVKTYAKALSVTPADWTDEDGNSIYTDVQTYTRNSGSKINLRYTLETRGQPIPDGNYDYDARYTTYVTLVNGGEGWVTGDSWTETMKGKTYTIRVTDFGTRYTYDTIIPITPFLTPKDQATGTLKPDDILRHFQKEIVKVSGWTAQVIGNGIYIKGPEEFSTYVSGGKGDVAMSVMTNKVNNIAKLPVQCKDGYIVQVLNTGEIEDDYYVKFVGTREGIDGVGAWEETVAPGLVINLNETTMPHQLIRMPDGTFMVSPVDWENRLVGDNKTNPVPSFVGKRINKIFFYRNRLGILSDENVILSRAGDYFNYFAKTALTVSDSDPIDLASSSTTPSVLHDAVPLNTGLILFSRDKQFILSTSQDVLTPVAVKLDVMSTYNCSETVPAFEMGSTVGFLAQAGRFSSMWEITNLNAQAIPEVIEQSKIVQELLPNTISSIANNKDNSLIVFGSYNSPRLYVYRYFNDGEKRIQSAWFEWSCAGTLVHHAVDDDTYYQVLKKDNRIYLTKSTIRPLSSEYLVISDITYSPRMDLRSTIPQSAITYNDDTRTSSFLSNYEYSSNAYVFGLGSGRFQGRAVQIQSIVPSGNKWLITIPGNWIDNFISIGYIYTMTVELPHSYYSKVESQRTVTDTRAYTNVHRMKFEFGKVGYFSITLTKKGKADYVSLYEQSPANDYRADTHEVIDSVIHTIPIYEKNTNVVVTLTSNHPTPCTLLSSMWEGTISPKSYKSV